MPICPFTKHSTRRSTASSRKLSKRWWRRWQRRPRVSSEEWTGVIDISSPEKRGTSDDATRSLSIEPMAIFPSSSKTSKKTTPRGPSALFNSKHNNSQQQKQQQEQQNLKVPDHQQHSPEKQEQQEQQQQQPLLNQQQHLQLQQQRRAPTQTSFSPVSLAPEKTSDNSPPLTSTSMDRGKLPPTERDYLEKVCLLDTTPESMVAETLRMKGELEFSRLLRVDGRFEGDLITDKGSLVVGPKGEVIGDLKNMTEVYVEGIVRGNVSAQDVKIKNRGMLYGDIECLCLTLDPTATIKGVADTATLKERANAEANAASSASSTEASTPASASTSFSTDKLMGALKNDTPEAAAATAEEALEVTVPTSRP